MELVVGIDAGGTSTRCVVATVDGTVVGRGLAGGASQRSSGGDPADALFLAVDAALSEVERQRVAGGVVGIAGAGAAGHAVAQASADAAWVRAALPGRPVVVGDLDVGYAAGTSSGTGSLLLAGTGAVAAAFSQGRLARRVDGYGWLLGDEGSAVWLGREGVRAVLAALDGRGPATSLADSLPADPQAILADVYGAPPARLGTFAPTVCAAATAGDQVACGIVGAGVATLLHGLATVHTGGPVVVAGSLLLTEGPVRDGVLAGIVERHGTRPVPGEDGAAGAAALAIAVVTGRPVAAEVHDRLTHRRG